MVGFAILLTAASQVGALGPLQGVFLTITSPVSRLANGTFRPVAGLLSSAGDSNALRDENRKLRLENEELQNQVVALQQATDRVAQLEAALDVQKAQTDQARLVANVVHRDASPFTDVVSIDRGSNAGVKVGMVVTSAQGTLIGTVTKVLSGQSFVRLVTDTKSKVAAETLESKAAGVVNGTPGRGLSFELSQADIKVGDLVVTSSLTGRYPAGITIGKVREVTGTPQDLFRTVKLEPTVRLSTATTVLVLTSFEPQDVGAQTR